MKEDRNQQTRNNDGQMYFRREHYLLDCRWPNANYMKEYSTLQLQLPDIRSQLPYNSNTQFQTQFNVQIVLYELLSNCDLDELILPLFLLITILCSATYKYQMIFQEENWVAPSKPTLKPLDDQLSIDQEEFLLEQQLSTMTLRDSDSEKAHSHFQPSPTEEDTVDELDAEETRTRSFKRGHKATQQVSFRERPMLGKLQRLQRMQLVHNEVPQKKDTSDAVRQFQAKQ